MGVRIDTQSNDYFSQYLNNVQNGDMGDSNLAKKIAELMEKQNAQESQQGSYLSEAEYSEEQVTDSKGKESHKLKFSQSFPVDPHSIKPLKINPEGQDISEAITPKVAEEQEQEFPVTPTVGISVKGVIYNAKVVF